MKKYWQLILPILLVAVTLIAYSVFTKDTDKEPELVRVKKGTFEVVVTIMGELEALESTQITIPDVLTNRSIRIRSLAITDIVKEGTVVKKGDYVATLNPAEVEEQLKNLQDGLDIHLVNLENTKIDSSLVLSEARDGIRQSRDLVKDREIKLEQSIYESKAVQRQAQINLEVSQRNMEQRIRNYMQMKRKHEIRVQRALDQIAEREEQVEMVTQLMRDLKISAPGDGLVVYARGHDGEKIRVGSQVNRWAPLIATLPNLATLQSVAFVNEIDISKINPDLPVRLRIDAFPESEFRGRITRVANVGQELPGQFLTGFKVEIKVDPEGKTLLPGMTATNHILVKSIKDVLMVPRQALHSADDLFFVYKREGLSTVKQQIVTAGENESFLWVTQGLKVGDRVMMHEPAQTEKIKFIGL